MPLTKRKQTLVSEHTSIIVVDSSLMVDALLDAELLHWPANVELAVPAHFDAEVGNALARLNRVGKITANDVPERLRLLADFPATRHPIGPLLTRAWAMRDNVAYLDAIYCALAVELGAVVWTRDQRLSRAHDLAVYINAGQFGSSE